MLFLALPKRFGNISLDKSAMLLCNIWFSQLVIALL